MKLKEKWLSPGTHDFELIEPEKSETAIIIKTLLNITRNHQMLRLVTRVHVMSKEDFNTLQSNFHSGAFGRSYKANSRGDIVVWKWAVDINGVEGYSPRNKKANVDAYYCTQDQWNEPKLADPKMTEGNRMCKFRVDGQGFNVHWLDDEGFVFQ